MQCTECLNLNPASARFCSQCGRMLADAPLPRSERRRVTVMFADLVGFTSIAEQLDAEAVHRLINTCFDRLVPIIEHYGGVVDKFIGDAIMAIFGAPLAHEDDPIRAVHAASAMLAAIAELSQQEGLELGLHIGINTGVVIAGGIGSLGRQQYSVIGDAVNLAARLQDLASNAEILVGPETQRMTAHVFDYAALGEKAIKGRSEHVAVFKLRGLNPRPSSGRGIKGLQSPMVGRHGELESLLAVTADLSKQRGRVVMAVGEAGIGKSRLLTEWRNQSFEQLPQVVWYEARCLSYTQESAYALLRDLVRSLIGVSINDGEDDMAAALHQIATALLLDQADQVIPALSHLLLLPASRRFDELSPQALQALYISAVRRLVLAQGQHTPVIWSIEDIHWADEASVDVLQNLLQLHNDIPLVILATSRPDREVVGWRLVESARDLSGLELNLAPLSLANGRELIANLLHFDGLPEHLRTAILNKADGNPFFVEEVIRTLIDREAIMHDGNSWVALEAINHIELPDSVHGLLAARIDRLPSELRQLLHIAAVIGRRFAIRVVAEVLGSTAEKMTNSIDLLVDRELLRRDRTNPNGYLRFRHALVHEVVYSTTLQTERRRLHGVVGETLEALYPSRREELAAALANHFMHAEHPKAFEYALLAGDVAYRQYALREAIRHYERAHDLSHHYDLPLSVVRGLYLNYARATELIGETKQALDLYQHVLERCESEHDTESLIIVLIEHARLLMLPSHHRDLDRSRSETTRALELATQQGDRQSEARCYWLLALIEGHLSRFTAAEPWGEKALSLARELGMRELQAYCLNDFHRVAINNGQPELAERMLREAIELWRSLNNLPMLADSLSGMADFYYSRRDLDQAVRYAREAERLALMIGNAWNLGFSRSVLGGIALETGDIQQALHMFQSSIEQSSLSGPIMLNMYGRTELIRLYRMLGDYQAALDVLEAGEAYIEQVNDEALIALRQLFIAMRLLITIEQTSQDPAELSETIRHILSFELGEQQVVAGVMLRVIHIELCLKLGDYGHAERLVAEIVEQLSALWFGGSLVSNYRARLAAAQGKLAEAIEFSEVLINEQPAGDIHDLWRFRAWRAEWLEAQGQFTLAVSERQHAQRLIQHISGNILRDELRERFLGLPLVQATLQEPSSSFII
ncbi:ATP-binding protein [Herpetosiphon geysericola]|nr:adenylate/guanylate cyclase domain-containing protein [Herpetosiphon geysericola]